MALRLWAFVCLFPGVSASGYNLLENPSAEAGFLSGWTVHSSTPSDGWGVERGNLDGCLHWTTSYEWCIRSQVIDLVVRGYDPEALDEAPAVEVSEWFSGKDPDPNDFAYLKVELRDASHVALATFETGVMQLSGDWRRVSHRFADYGPGLRYIYWEDGGKDTEFWRGQFGARLDAASCGIELPAPALPRLQVSHEVIDFGSQGTGDGRTPAETIVLTNTGEATLAFNVCLRGLSSGDFVITSLPPGRTLGPGQSTFVSVAFDPTLDGEPFAWLRVWSSDPDNATREVLLVGASFYTPPVGATYFELLDMALLWYGSDPFAYDLVPDGRIDEKDLLQFLRTW